MSPFTSTQISVDALLAPSSSMLVVVMSDRDSSSSLSATAADVVGLCGVVPFSRDSLFRLRGDTQRMLYAQRLEFLYARQYEHKVTLTTSIPPIKPRRVLLQRLVWQPLKHQRSSEVFVVQAVNG